MKHFFIINPTAGALNSSEKLLNIIQEIFKDNPNDYETYITKSIGDATRVAAEKAKTITEDTVFYACGGDGTCFDVLNGIMGCEHAIFGILPVGSCNDFLKTFKDLDFKDFSKIVNGEIKNIDVCCANGYYFINEINIGFDARVNDDCNNSKIKAKNIRKAYRRAIIKNLLRPLGQRMRVLINDEVVIDKDILLLVAANGSHYGGKYCCAPYADVQDGLFEFIAVNKISLFKFISLIKQYEKGKHLELPKFRKHLHYSRESKLTFQSDTSLCACLDGEIFHWNEINVEVLPGQLRMIFPKNE